MRISQTRTFAIRPPSSPSVIKDLSTIPICPFLGNLELSNLVLLFKTLFEDIPIKTVLSSTVVFSLIIPHLSNLL